MNYTESSSGGGKKGEIAEMGKSSKNVNPVADYLECPLGWQKQHQYDGGVKPVEEAQVHCFCYVVS